jgi:hypothetical protein
MRVVSLTSIDELQMWHLQRRQQQVHNTKQSFTQYESTCQHNDRRLTSSLPSPPPQADQPTNRAGQRKARGVVHSSITVSIIPETHSRVHLPTATAIPPGTKSIHHPLKPLIFLLLPHTLTAVATAKITAAPPAHSLTIGGSPDPVTSLAVKTHT